MQGATPDRAVHSGPRAGPSAAGGKGRVRAASGGPGPTGTGPGLGPDPRFAAVSLRPTPDRSSTPSPGVAPRSSPGRTPPATRIAGLVAPRQRQNLFLRRDFRDDAGFVSGIDLGSWDSVDLRLRGCGDGERFTRLRF